MANIHIHLLWIDDVMPSDIYKQINTVKYNDNLTPIILEGSFKEDVNIFTPIVTISIPTEEVSGLIKYYWNKVNYVKIEEFNRWYFVSSKTINLGNIMTLSLKEDVLYTGYANDYKWYYYPLFCSRRTNGSISLVDNLMSFKYKKEITLPNITPYNGIQNVVFDVTANDPNKMCVVVSAIAQKEVNGLITMNLNNHSPILADGKLPSLDGTSNGDDVATRYYVMDYACLTELIDKVYNNDNLKSYIKSILILPYAVPYDEIPLYQGWHSIYIGNDVIKLVDSTLLPDNSKTGWAQLSNYNRFVKETYEIPDSDDFLDYAPFKELEMWIPYHKFVKLDLESVRGCKIDLIYYVDYETGAGQVVLYNTDKDTVEYTADIQLGVKIGVSSSNQLEINNQKLQLGVSSAIGVLSSLISLGVGGSTANPMMLASGVVGMASTLSKTATGACALITRGEVASSSGLNGINLPQEVYFRQIEQVPNIKRSDSNYNYYKYDKGLPYNDYISIKNDTTVGERLFIDDDSIPLEEGMTIDEYNELVGLLKNGIRA